MKLKPQNILLVFLFLLFSACASESERILNEKLSTEQFDFENLRHGPGNIHSESKGNIQYGLIDLENGEQVKFWFLTHHATSDIGGTVYEFPNGERMFCSGNHCCEVQFYDEGGFRKFQNIEEFKSYVTENDGLRP